MKAMMHSNLKLAAIAAAALIVTGAAVSTAITALGAGPAAAPPPAGTNAGPGAPARINEYKGMQEREEVFQFAEKPKIE